jgi:class 3 adenylate cyclase
VQQSIPAGEQSTLTPTLEAGRYRLRTLQYPGGQHLRVAADGAPEITLYPDARESSAEELLLARSPTLHFVNPSMDKQVFILERTAWSDQAVTAAEVTALQLFRSLFSSEALRPGEQIAVGSITIVFTDLRGSTRLYREIGDAPAFGRVMNHFDVLTQVVADEGGALVKTIGDAVMAVFPRPIGALRAMLQAQYTLAHPPEGMLPMCLKAGIHTGPCIAVTLNERLDYFGSTVNLAARLEGVSSGKDVVITSDVADDPEIQEWLAQHRQEVAIEPFSQTLKGFDTEEFALCRIRLQSDDAGVLQPEEQAALP